MWFTEYLKSILLRTTAQKKYFFQNIPTIDNAVEEGSPSVLMPIQLLSPSPSDLYSRRFYLLFKQWCSERTHRTCVILCLKCQHAEIQLSWTICNFPRAQPPPTIVQVEERCSGHSNNNRWHSAHVLSTLLALSHAFHNDPKKLAL